MTQSRIGVGLRPTHYPHLFSTSTPPRVDWFEAISENYMDSQGRPLEMLDRVRADFPVALHGVSMSLGAKQLDGVGIRPQYLKNLKRLIDRVDPIVVSDHLCWTGLPHGNAHDLLPLPFTDEALNWIVDQIDFVQNALGRKIAIENVSSYLTYKESTYSEWEFINQVLSRSGCQLLLDVNNVYVSAQNHDFSAEVYLDSIPAENVAQIHLAGHTDMGDFLFDTHSAPVCDDVWELFRKTLSRMSHVPVLIEWDEDIPDFAALEQEASKARKIWEQVRG